MFTYKKYSKLKPYNPIVSFRALKLRKTYRKFAGSEIISIRSSMFDFHKKLHVPDYSRFELVSSPELIDYSYTECAQNDYITNNSENFMRLINVLSSYDLTDSEFEIVLDIIERNMGVLCFHYDESCNMNAVVNSIMISSMHVKDDVPSYFGGYMINSAVVARMNDDECERFLVLYDDCLNNGSSIAALNKISIALFKCSEDLNDSCWHDVLRTL